MALLVSVGCRSCVPQSQCWPGCPSGRRRGACVAAGRSDRHTGSSCSAFSVSCGGRDLLRPERSGMAVGSERVTHLRNRSTTTLLEGASDGTACCCFVFSSALYSSDRPVLLLEVELLLVLAATLLAFVIHCCRSACKLSDPAASLDAPRGSLSRK